MASCALVLHYSWCFLLIPSNDAEYVQAPASMHLKLLIKIIPRKTSWATSHMNRAKT